MTHDDDEYDEADTTAAEFDAMWDASESVETVVPTARPSVRATNNYVVTFEAETTDVVEKPSTSGSFDEDDAPAPDSTRQAFEPRQPVLLPSA